jgi:hypothetical protein
MRAMVTVALNPSQSSLHILTGRISIIKGDNLFYRRAVQYCWRAAARAHHERAAELPVYSSCT